MSARRKAAGVAALGIAPLALSALAAARPRRTARWATR